MGSTFRILRCVNMPMSYLYNTISENDITKRRVRASRLFNMYTIEIVCQLTMLDNRVFKYQSLLIVDERQSTCLSNSNTYTDARTVKKGTEKTEIARVCKQIIQSQFLYFHPIEHNL